MVFRVIIAKSLKKSLSVGSLSESINSDDLMLDIDYDPTDDKYVDSDNEDLVNTKNNAFHELKSLTSSRYLLNNYYQYTNNHNMKYYYLLYNNVTRCITYINIYIREQISNNMIMGGSKIFHC